MWAAACPPDDDSLSEDSSSEDNMDAGSGSMDDSSSDDMAGSGEEPDCSCYGPTASWFKCENCCNNYRNDGYACKTNFENASYCPYGKDVTHAYDINAMWAAACPPDDDSLSEDSSSEDNMD